MKQIDNKKIDISDEEYEYYLELVKGLSSDTFNGASYFEDLFEVDGPPVLITLVITIASYSMTGRFILTRPARGDSPRKSLEAAMIPPATRHRSMVQSTWRGIWTAEKSVPGRMVVIWNLTCGAMDGLI